MLILVIFSLIMPFEELYSIKPVFSASSLKSFLKKYYLIGTRKVDHPNAVPLPRGLLLPFAVAIIFFSLNFPLLFVLVCVSLFSFCILFLHLLYNTL